MVIFVTNHNCGHERNPPTDNPITVDQLKWAWPVFHSLSSSPYYEELTKSRDFVTHNTKTF